jgi:hypothetical protein
LRRLREEAHEIRTNEAAGVEKPRPGEGEAEGDEELPPFVGWTVVGHDWKFHVAWKDSSGKVVSFFVSCICP